MRSVVSVVSLCDNKEDVRSDSKEDEGTKSDDVGKEGDDFNDVEDIDEETCDLDVISESEDFGRSVRESGVTTVEFVIAACSAFEEILTGVIDE